MDGDRDIRGKPWLNGRHDTPSTITTGFANHLHISLDELDDQLDWSFFAPGPDDTPTEPYLDPIAHRLHSSHGDLHPYSKPTPTEDNATTIEPSKPTVTFSSASNDTTDAS